jgi:murein L,D-transpeptidase YcbB/YkuD
MNTRKKLIFLCYVGLAFGLLNFVSVTSAAVSNNNPAYQRLAAMLPLYQSAVQHPWPRLNTAETLSLGRQGPDILVLRQRLCATHDLSATICKQQANSPIFDKELAEAVAFFQERHGLMDDGQVGKLTRQALNISPEQRMHQIQINLQRWSRLIALAEPAYIWINIPDHYLRLIKDHHAILMARIIVGKLSRQTPEINSKVTRIVLNPYWTVPPGIARNDVIPQIIKNKDYLQQHRMRVFSVNRPNKALDPDEVDWLAAQQNPARIILRQDPGPHNALGQIKFEFSNPYMIYLHDTPSKRLFDAQRRLFSSGCVRMEDPFELLEALAEFDPSIKQSEAHIESALESGETVTLRLKQAIPIHLTYITAWVDKAGVLHFWDDVYSRDPKPSATQKEKLEQDLAPAI